MELSAPFFIFLEKMDFLYFLNMREISIIGYDKKKDCLFSLLLDIISFSMRHSLNEDNDLNGYLEFYCVIFGCYIPCKAIKVQLKSLVFHDLKIF